MREIILSLKAQGKTIFFNSHVLSEVEQICDRVAILAGGELICSGSIEQLLGVADTYYVKGKGGNFKDLNQWISNLQLNSDGSWHGQIIGEPDDFLANLRRLNARITTLKLSHPSLEEFFLKQLRQREGTTNPSAASKEF